MKRDTGLREFRKTLPDNHLINKECRTLRETILLLHSIIVGAALHTKASQAKVAVSMDILDTREVNNELCS
jgi:hypothetical protein